MEKVQKSSNSVYYTPSSEPLKSTIYTTEYDPQPILSIPILTTHIPKINLRVFFPPLSLFAVDVYQEVSPPNFYILSPSTQSSISSTS
jgi:hypothetical protein